MKYAVIADVHGNAPALRLAMADALSCGAQGFLFAGDYCIRAPWPNEVVALLRGAPQRVAVRGNEERYLHVPDGDDGQFAVSRWTKNEMKREHIAWIDALPERADFTCEGVAIHMAHSSEAFIADAEIGRFATRMLPLRYPGGPVAHEAFLADIRGALARDAALQRRLSDMPGGVYIFGHTHSQWHARFGDHLLLNPGSCGQPLDCQEFGAAYTLLTVQSGEATVEERRVRYDAETLIRRARAAGLYREAPVWSEIVFGEWRSCRELAMYFLRYAEAYAKRAGDPVRPFSRDTWNAAFRAWRREADPRMMVSDADFPR